MFIKLNYLLLQILHQLFLLFSWLKIQQCQYNTEWNRQSLPEAQKVSGFLYEDLLLPFYASTISGRLCKFFISFIQIVYVVIKIEKEQIEVIDNKPIHPTTNHERQRKLCYCQ